MSIYNKLIVNRIPLLKIAMMNSTNRSFRFGAFNNKPGWKMNAAGDAIEMKDGNPIWIDANGAEATLQGDAITRANNDAKTARIAKEAAEAKLAAFKGVDPEIALKAVEDIKKIDTKKLIDAGKVDEVKEEMRQQFTAQLNEKDTAIQATQRQLDDMRINNVFAQSEFVRNDLAIPRDMFEAATRSHFKIGKDGAVEAYDKAGNRLMSRKSAGDYADAEEALQLIVDAHPQKEVILKAPDHRGSGNNGGGGGNGGKRVIKRGEFDKLDPMKQAEIADKAGKGELTIVD